MAPAADPAHADFSAQTLEDCGKASSRLEQFDAHWINKPSVTQQGTVREEMPLTVSDECGNAIEFRGLRKFADVYAVREIEAAPARQATVRINHGGVGK